MNTFGHEIDSYIEEYNEYKEAALNAIRDAEDAIDEMRDCLSDIESELDDIYFSNNFDDIYWQLESLETDIDDVDSDLETDIKTSLGGEEDEDEFEESLKRKKKRRLNATLGIIPDETAGIDNFNNHAFASDGTPGGLSESIKKNVKRVKKNANIL